MVETFQADGIKATFETPCGTVLFSVSDGGREIDMMHRAPWRDPVPAGAAQDGLPPHLHWLAGDFFCAPFADARADNAPLHGWPANAPWQAMGVQRQGAKVVGRWGLGRAALGAGLVKELTLVDGQAFLYQRHIFTGGHGRMPVANHAMIRVPDGAVIRTSEKRAWATPDNPQESDPVKGRSILRYPFVANGPEAFPLLDGGTVDLRRYPLGKTHEDFVMAIEAPGHAFGWVAVTRPATQDLYLSLRDAQALPLSMFWHSNGGRHYAPWSSRHIGVLGIEEGVGFEGRGFLSADTQAAMQADGQPMALDLSPLGQVEVRHAIGQIAWASGEPVAEVRLTGDQLTITGEGGAQRVLPVLSGFLPG